MVGYSRRLAVVDVRQDTHVTDGVLLALQGLQLFGADATGHGD